MAQINESVRHAKNGLEVTFLSPGRGAGAEIVTLVKDIMSVSLHLLTEKQAEDKITKRIK